MIPTYLFYTFNHKTLKYMNYIFDNIIVGMKANYKPTFLFEQKILFHIILTYKLIILIGGTEVKNLHIIYCS